MSTPEGAVEVVEQKQEQQQQQQKQQKPKKEQKPKAPAAGDKNKSDASQSLGVSAKKAEDFSKWYQQLVVRSELIDYYDISGCYILRPWSYEIWEHVKEFLDTEFKKLGVKNCYFPMFVPKKNLEKEKDHVEGFSAEVAWVTHSGSTKLEEPIAVRPTSETGMYPTFSKWIHSHRDLPLLLNQWCNVVRWEFKDPTPFIRSREFLWQEGHTVHSNLPDAEKEVYQILDIYARAYEDILACSVVKGKKTEFEKFAGGFYTTTVEGYIPGSGRGIQAATSHCLGQNFSKMFDIQFQGESGQQEFAWQNSWGFTTRSIGVMLMTHSDDKGLVLPPKIAPVQVVLIPIIKGDNAAVVTEATDKLAAELKAKGLRVQIDARQNVTPGFKYNHWELKGVPLRVEIGGRDIDNKTAFVARRDLGTKSTIPWANFGNDVEALLDTIQNDLKTKAKIQHNDAIKQVRTWDAFMENLKHDRLNLTPWCGSTDCEKSIKVKSGEDSSSFGGDKVGAAKSLCIPLEQPTDDITQEKCLHCAGQAQSWVLFGRSY